MMRNKIQYGGTKTNPLQRRAKTVTLMARSAAGTGGTTERLIDIRQADAERWMDWIQPGGNKTCADATTPEVAPTVEVAASLAPAPEDTPAPDAAPAPEATPAPAPDAATSTDAETR